MKNRRLGPGAFFFILILAALMLPSTVCAGKGYYKEASVPYDERTHILFIGDSRTQAMHDSIGEAENSRSSWIAQGGMGFEWFRDTGIPRAEEVMRRGDMVAICMGINDILEPRGGLYAELVNEKAAEWKGRGVRTFFISAGPLEDEKKAANGSPKRNTMVVEFNNAVRDALGIDVVFVDLYDWILADYTTWDGTHYSDEVSKKLYYKIRDELEAVWEYVPARAKIRLYRNLDAADAVMRSITLTEGAGEEIPDPVTDDEGPVLVGWSYRRDSSKTGFAASAVPGDQWIVEHEDGIDLYAVWSP